jgi:fluoroacetyl-CoA thioesterase
MKDSLATGVQTTQRIIVDPKRTIGFMGDKARIYATPELVRDIEQTCRDMLLKHLDAGEDSVGARVEIDHLAPTLLGMWVDVTAKIIEVKGRKVVFELKARDPVEEICRGRHVRFVVEVAATEARLAAKAQKAA